MYTTSKFWFNSVRLKKYLKILIEYKHLYDLYLDSKYLKRSTSNNFTTEDRLRMNEIEMDLDLDCLITIRRVMFRRRINEQLSYVNNQQRLTDTTESSNYSWYMSYAKWISLKTFDLWKTTTTATPTDINQSIISTATPIVPLNENDQRLQDQVNTFIAQSLEDQYLSQNRRDAVQLRLNFTLKSVQIGLLSNNIVAFNFSLNNVHFSVIKIVAPL